MLVSDEELLRGDIAGLPEVIQPAEDVPEGYEWATTEYLYDITQEYYQVIGQTTTCGNTTTTTAYAYGLERIAAYSPATTTEYIYDGRGSIAQTVSAPIAGADVSAALQQVQSYSYTAFGEQMGVKVSGFGYNAEDYDAGTGMINLRMRQYEVMICRFQQKDKVYGKISVPLSLNRQGYCINNPLFWKDPSGMTIKNYLEMMGNFDSKKLFEETLSEANTTSAELLLSTSKLTKVTKSLNEKFNMYFDLAVRNYSYLNENDQRMIQRAQEKLKEIENSDEPEYIKLRRKNAVISRTCTALSVSVSANDYVVYTTEDDEDPNVLLHSVLSSKKLDYSLYTGSKTTAYAEDNWETNYYPDNDCINYTSYILKHNGLTTNDVWKPRTETWRLTSYNYRYMTNKSDVTNPVFAGEILIDDADEAYAMIEVGALGPQKGDMLYNMPSNQDYPDHVFVVNDIDSEGSPYFTAHTTNRKRDSLTVIMNAVKAKEEEMKEEMNEEITYSFSYVYMGGIE